MPPVVLRSSASRPSRQSPFRQSPFPCRPSGKVEYPFLCFSSISYGFDDHIECLDGQSNWTNSLSSPSGFSIFTAVLPAEPRLNSTLYISSYEHHRPTIGQLKPYLLSPDSSRSPETGFRASFWRNPGARPPTRSSHLAYSGIPPGTPENGVPLSTDMRATY